MVSLLYPRVFSTHLLSHRPEHSSPFSYPTNRAESHQSNAIASHEWNSFNDKKKIERDTHLPYLNSIYYFFFISAVRAFWSFGYIKRRWTELGNYRILTAGTRLICAWDLSGSNLCSTVILMGWSFDLSERDVVWYFLNTWWKAMIFFWTRREFLREILYKNIAIIVMQHGKFILLTTLAIFPIRLGDIHPSPSGKFPYTY